MGGAIQQAVIFLATTLDTAYAIFSHFEPQSFVSGQGWFRWLHTKISPIFIAYLLRYNQFFGAFDGPVDHAKLQVDRRKQVRAA